MPDVYSHRLRSNQIRFQSSNKSSKPQATKHSRADGWIQASLWHWRRNAEVILDEHKQVWTRVEIRPDIYYLHCRDRGRHLQRASCKRSCSHAGKSHSAHCQLNLCRKPLCGCTRPAHPIWVVNRTRLRNVPAGVRSRALGVPDLEAWSNSQTTLRICDVSIRRLSQKDWKWSGAP